MRMFIFLTAAEVRTFTEEIYEKFFAFLRKQNKLTTFIISMKVLGKDLGRDNPGIHSFQVMSDRHFVLRK